MRYHLTSTDQQAVVLGGGLDAVLAARVLTEHFRRVTLVTPEMSPERPTLPQTIWQALPMHALAVQGCRNLERLFPGLTAELLVARAPTVEWTADAALLLPGGWAPRFHSDLITRPVTHNLLVHLLRQRLLEYAEGRIAVVEGRDVAGFRRSPAVTGVLLQGKAAPEVLAADLVVMAGGRQAHEAAWLRDAGLPAPPVMHGRSSAVAARLYHPPAGFQAGWQALLVVGAGDGPGGALVPVEQGHWLVMLTAPPGAAPADNAGFLGLARRLRTPVLAEVLEHAQPLTPIFTHQEAQAARWRYDQVSDWPDGLLMTGAAMTTFDPAAGFEVTAATLAALALRESLDDQRRRCPDGDLAGFSQRFHARLARAYALPWMLLDDGDSEPGERYQARFVRHSRDRLLATAHADPQVFHALLAVASLAAPPRVLLKPGIVRRALGQSDPALLDTSPPEFAPAHLHRTISQEIAAVAGHVEAHPGA